MFQVRAFNPHPLLRQWVDSYLIVSADQPEGNYIENNFFPHVTQSFVIGLDNRRTVYDCIRSEFCCSHFITGPNEEVCRIRLFPGMKKMIINFRPAGFFKIFQIPAHHFTNRSLNAELFFGKELIELSNQLKEGILSKKIELMDGWLLSRLQQQKKECRNIEDAIRLIERNKGNITLRELGLATYTTKRTLERHFLEQVGLYPKIFSRLVRFNEVIRFIESNLNIKWARLPELFGYYDQSHFIHEFKSLTGGLPQDYFSMKTDFEKLILV